MNWKKIACVSFNVNKFNKQGAGILSSVVWSEGLIKLELNTQTIKVNDKLQFFPYEN